MLETRRRLGNLRTLPPRRELIDFASNDYLGLARSPALARRVLEEWSRLGFALGATGSRLLTGNSTYAEELEAMIAQMHGYEAGLLFNCGYMANLGVLSLVRAAETLLFDAHVHASTHDAIRLHRIHAFPFRHNDLDHLERRLANSSSPCWICVESIYSTDGSRAPCEEIQQLAARYEARLIVDEAHAVGVFGMGLARGCVKVVTFGKAMGGHGAIVLCRRAVREYLINFARPFVYTTALPFPMLATIKCSYQLLPSLDPQRQQLHRLMSHFPQCSPIQSVKRAGNHAVRGLSERLAQAGFDVRPLMSPTVQRGHEAIRICLHAYNTPEQLHRLLACLASS